MGGQRIVDVQAGFTEGLNTVSDPASLGASQARLMQNSVLTSYGAAAKRAGTQHLSLVRPNAGSAVTGGLWWPSQNEFVVTAGSNLYVSSGGAGPGLTWSAITAANGTLGLGCVFRVFTGASGADTVYIAAAGNQLCSLGVGNVYTLNVSNAANFTGIEVYNNRLWGWLYTGNALYFSNLASAAGSIGGDSLGLGASGGGQINIVTFGTSNIYTCAVIGSSLLIFHERGISRLTGFGLSDITVQPQAVTPDFSLVGPWSVTTYNGIGWAVGFSGLASVTENGVALVGTPARPDPLPSVLAALGAEAAFNTSIAYDSVLQQVMISVPNQGVYIYHTILGAWSGPWNGGVYANTVNGRGCFIQFPGSLSSNLEPYVLFADHDGWLYQTNVGALDAILADGTGGSAYSQVVQCRRLFGQSPLEPGGARAYAKSWRWANVLAQLSGSGTAPVITLSSQYGGSSTFTVSPVANVQQPYYVPAGGVGPYLDVTITDQGSGASEYAMVEVEGFYLGQR